MRTKPDFSGYVSKNDQLCEDNTIIRANAFAGDNGKTVPLVWHHQHDTPSNVLGHAVLENRKDGVYAYGYFNDSKEANDARIRVQHGDITMMSIWANNLKRAGQNIMHGVIREVSLVMAGSDPTAKIDVESIALAHGIEAEYVIDEAIITTGEQFREVDNGTDDTIAHAADEIDVEAEFNSLSDSQKDAVYIMLNRAKEMGAESVQHDSMTEEQTEEVTNDNIAHSSEGGNENMGAWNAFENTQQNEAPQQQVLSHDAMKSVFGDAESYGSLKKSWIAHAQEYGIDPIDYLFPEAKSLNTPPDWIKRDTGWVSDLMNRTHHTPFSRIKSQFANITEDEARARGYIKGHQKKDEVFTLLRRTTTPQTIYKRQKLDRDDIIDITDFDVVAWIKAEMRVMLDEEIARAVLIGDGRSTASEDKISEDHIRPIATDSDLYTIKYKVDMSSDLTEAQLAKKFIQACVKARKDYKGSGDPILFTSSWLLTEMLLLEDLNQRIIYDTEEKLRTALRVSKIVTVELIQESTTIAINGVEGQLLMGIIVNPVDYNIGADKGGAVSLFDDFDIDYNRYTYLIETRISGALIRPFSAITIYGSAVNTTRIYNKVMDTEGKNPAEEGWYEQIKGNYFLTTDEEPVGNKKYYTVSE